MTISLQNLIGDLIDSPRLKLVVDELNHRFDGEQRAREKFIREQDEDIRAEFISGKVVKQMSSRKEHVVVLGWIADVVKAFIRLKRLGEVHTEQSLVRMTRNDYLPDLAFWTTSVAASFKQGQTIYPTPPFVCEVLSPDTESRDRGVKFEDYAAHGVVEYWIVDPDKQTIEQYRNVDGEFELVKKFNAKKDAAGSIKSLAIKNFAMPVRAAFDEAANARALKRLWTKKK